MGQGLLVRGLPRGEGPVCDTGSNEGWSQRRGSSVIIPTNFTRSTAGAEAGTDTAARSQPPASQGAGPDSVASCGQRDGAGDARDGLTQADAASLEAVAAATANLAVLAHISSASVPSTLPVPLPHAVLRGAAPPIPDARAADGLGAAAATIPAAVLTVAVPPCAATVATGPHQLSELGLGLMAPMKAPPRPEPVASHTAPLSVLGGTPTSVGSFPAPAHAFPQAFTYIPWPPLSQPSSSTSEGALWHPGRVLQGATTSASGANTNGSALFPPWQGHNSTSRRAPMPTWHAPTDSARWSGNPAVPLLPYFHWPGGLVPMMVHPLGQLGQGLHFQNAGTTTRTSTGGVTVTAQTRMPTGTLGVPGNCQWEAEPAPGCDSELRPGGRATFVGTGDAGVAGLKVRWTILRFGPRHACSNFGVRAFKFVSLLLGSCLVHRVPVTPRSRPPHCQWYPSGVLDSESVRAFHH